MATTAISVPQTGTTVRAQIIAMCSLGHVNTAPMGVAHVRQANLSANAAEISWAQDARNVPQVSMAVRAANFVTPSLHVAAAVIVQRMVTVGCIACQPPRSVPMLSMSLTDDISSLLQARTPFMSSLVCAT